MTDRKQSRPASTAAKKAQAERAAEPLAKLSAAANAMSAADMAVIETAELFMTAGRIEAFNFMSAVSDRSIAEQYLRAKALIGKLGSLPYRDRSGKVGNVSGIDEFCSVFLHHGERRCRQLAGNLTMLGAELYDQAEALGFRARDYQAIKALPDDEQALVKRAIAAGSKEEAIEILSEFAVRNSAMRQKSLDDDKTIEAKERVIAKRDAKLARFEEKAELPQAAAMLTEVQERIRTLVAATLQLGNVVVDLDQRDMPEELRLMVNADCEYAAQTFADILMRAGIPVQFQEMVDPSWMKNATKAARKG